MALAGSIVAAAPLIGPHTSVLSLQNGLGHEDVLAAVVGRDKVLAGKHGCIGELDGSVTPRVQALEPQQTRLGIVILPSELINQHDEVVQQGEHHLMIPRSGS